MSFYLPAILAELAAGAERRTCCRVAAFSWSLLAAPARPGGQVDRPAWRAWALLTSTSSCGRAGHAGAAPNLAVWYIGWTVIGFGMAMGLYDAAFATVGSLLQREAGPTITGVTLVAGFASTVFWTLGAALIAPLGWRGLMLAYAG
jgi:hypothetical protein